MIKTLIFSFFLFASTSAISSESVILDQTTRNWRQVSLAAASDDLPVVIVVSSEHCGYCELLKTRVMKPMQDSGKLQDAALVREMDLDTGGKIIDFDGEKVRARVFLRRLKVFATPTVLFLDHQGNPLYESIVGFNGVEQYQPMLEQALRESHLHLKRTKLGDSQKMAGQL